ncbi:MAG: patatin-like phospholipase family protein, partial [Thermoleophilia bacterium]|nr:patatin-like phospholipase family protein [Thermoleophilia bacterium]
MQDSAAPDFLVLGGGGVLGDAWMCALLAGLEESGRLEPAKSGRFVGTSAGSIVATRLAAGVDLPAYVRHRLSRNGTSRQGNEGSAPAPVAEAAERGASGDSPDPADGSPPAAGLEAAIPVASRLGAAALPLDGLAGRWVRRTILRRIPEGEEELGRLGTTMERIAPEWDPRLKIVGVESTTGERVVFSSEYDHGLRVSEAVRASCAIPGVFRAVEGNRGTYVDGGVWSPANLDAVHSSGGETVLALLPIGASADAGSRRYRLAAGVFRLIVAGEVLRLRNRGVRVVTVAPDAASAAAIGPDRMDGSRESEVVRAGLTR